MKAISKIIIGEPRAPMQEGKSIYEDLSMFTLKFSEVEFQLSSSTKVISSAFKQCHEIQKNCFTNCLNLPPESLHLIMVCFGQNLPT
jgi:hypothetical protein